MTAIVIRKVTDADTKSYKSPTLIWYEKFPMPGKAHKFAPPAECFPLVQQDSGTSI